MQYSRKAFASCICQVCTFNLLDDYSGQNIAAGEYLLYQLSSFKLSCKNLKMALSTAMAASAILALSFGEVSKSFLVILLFFSLFSGLKAMSK